MFNNEYFQTPSVMLGYLIVAGSVLTYLRRPTGKMTVIEQKLEGEYRYINSRLITNSEEIAFYNGNNREKLTMLASFNKLVSIILYVVGIYSVAIQMFSFYLCADYFVY